MKALSVAPFAAHKKIESNTTYIGKGAQGFVYIRQLLLSKKTNTQRNDSRHVFSSIRRALLRSRRLPLALRDTLDAPILSRPLSSREVLSIFLDSDIAAQLGIAICLGLFVVTKRSHLRRAFCSMGLRRASHCVRLGLITFRFLLLLSLLLLLAQTRRAGPFGVCFVPFFMAKLCIGKILLTGMARFRCKFSFIETNCRVHPQSTTHRKAE